MGRRQIHIVQKRKSKCPPPQPKKKKGKKIFNLSHQRTHSNKTPLHTHWNDWNQQSDMPRTGKMAVLETFLHCWWRHTGVWPLWSSLAIKLKTLRHSCPAIYLLAMQADMHQWTYIRMFITALFIKEKSGNKAFNPISSHPLSTH